MLDKTISTTTAIAGIVFVTFMNGFVSTNMMKQHSSMYKESSDSLIVMNQRLHSELQEFYKFGIEVDVTMYQPVYPQTDKTPDITADGTRIRISKASEYKFVALSMNLLKRTSRQHLCATQLLTMEVREIKRYTKTALGVLINLNVMRMSMMGRD